ncbi:hypothetical protein BDF22DRAFT_616505 [Syncephalis plumigaleata]|nr:hypothetical protein BDF22DRAFT_616505 [Syncephalis plumigaleata]
MSLLAPNPHSTPATPALPPPPPSNVASVRTAVNLSVLKRHIPSVKGIIDSASHAVLYEFEPETREWTKKNVEGAMFIVERDVVPLFGFFILNRLGLDNAQAYLEPQLVLHQTDEYIMYRSDNQNGGTSPIYGLWIYDPTDRERIWQRLNQ